MDRVKQIDFMETVEARNKANAARRNSSPKVKKALSKYDYLILDEDRKVQCG